MRTRRIQRRVIQAVAATAVAVGVFGIGAAPASAGPCYTVTYDDGSPNPPYVTVCPFD